MMQLVLVTGGRGFVGMALSTAALSKGFAVRISSRQKLTTPRSLLEFCQVGDLCPTTDWFAALQGIDAVVHCAGRAHVMKDTAVDPLAIFRTVNLDGTLSLARQAVEARVKRFVFISSIGVNGAQTVLGKPFSEIDKPNPHNAYALSKWEAEQGLLRIAAETGMEVVIIRPPLVYGPGAPGNFGSLIRWLQRGVPLPLGAIHNQRSLVALDNLVDLIVTCLTHPAAANQTFLVSDGEDVSTTELLRRMGQATGHPARLVSVPAGLLKLAATMLGKRDVAQRLCGSLQVDIEKTLRLLDWTPPLSLDQGLKKAAEGYGRETGI
jgi:nucleoside-diphosphate-sugar epimerase